MAIEQKEIQEELNKKLNSYIKNAPRQILKTQNYRCDMSEDFKRLTEASLYLFQKDNIKIIEKIGLLHTIQETLDNNWCRIEKKQNIIKHKDSWDNKIPENIRSEWIEYLNTLIPKNPNKEKLLQTGKIILIETWDLLEIKNIECAKKSINIEEIINSTITELKNPHMPKWETEREIPSSNIKSWRENLTEDIKQKTPYLLSQKSIKKILELHPKFKISPIENASSIRYVSKEIIEALEPLEIKKCIDSFIEFDLLTEEQLQMIYKNFKNEKNPHKAVRDFLIENS